MDKRIDNYFLVGKIENEILILNKLIIRLVDYPKGKFPFQIEYKTIEPVLIL